MILLNHPANPSQKSPYQTGQTSKFGGFEDNENRVYALSSYQGKFGLADAKSLAYQEVRAGDQNKSKKFSKNQTTSIFLLSSEKFSNPISLFQYHLK